MKQSLLAVLYVLLLAACSTYNRIHTNEENGLKTMRLGQSFEVCSYKETDHLAGPSLLKVNINYLYEEKYKARPVITLRLKADNPVNGLPDSAFTVYLEGENIPLITFKGQYIVPENLWAPIVHSQNIRYKTAWNGEQVIISLNEKQKDQMVEFFNRAIKQRDDIFPAIPEGQKKW